MDLKQILKSVKLHESTVSMILGFIVIVVAGVILVNYFTTNKGQTIPPLQIGDESSDTKTHTVATGEDLWSISEQYYGSGYNWVDIAKENNISDPNKIEAGQTLVIPSVAPRTTEEKIATNVIEPTEEVKPTEELKPTIELQPTVLAQRQVTPTVGEDAVSTSNTAIEKTGTHTVQKGENLWKIAESVYGSGYNWVDIAKENNLRNPGVISEGETLVLPQVNAKTPTIVANKNAEPIYGTSYIVKKGDNLWNIAVRAYGDGYKWVQIAKENKLDNPGLIFAGNELSLPR